VELKGIYTKKEQEAILKGAAEYDRRCELELVSAMPSEKSLVLDLLEAFERENFDVIRSLQDDVAMMTRLREAFPHDSEIRDWTAYFIRIETEEIKDLLGEIKNGRKKIANLERIHRAGQGDFGSGDAT